MLRDVLPVVNYIIRGSYRLLIPARGFPVLNKFCIFALGFVSLKLNRAPFYGLEVVGRSPTKTKSGLRSRATLNSKDYTMLLFESIAVKAITPNLLCQSPFSGVLLLYIVFVLAKTRLFDR